MFKIAGEDDYGKTEYKRQLTGMNNTKIKKYATQMKFRLIEGNGEAIYLIGVRDNGFILGVENKNYLLYCKLMSKIAREINSKIVNIELIGSELIYMKFTIKAYFECDSIFNF